MTPTETPSDTDQPRAPEPFDVDEFMQLARDRYAFALGQDAEDRRIAEQDVAFVGADGDQQWTPKALLKRKRARLPILTWNRLPVFVAQIVNDGRENKPSIRCSAMDGGNPATAEFYQDRIRHLEYECDADIAWDMVRRQQVVSGRGFVRVSTSYKPKSFDQRLCIDAIENQFAVLWDPAAKRYDKSDGDYWFVSSVISKDAYERAYGKDTAAGAANYFAEGSNPAPDWIGIGPDGQMIQVAEYWLKEYTRRTLCLLEDLTAVYQDEMTGREKSPVMDTRVDDACRVMQYIIDGVGIVDSTEWIGTHIPIVPMWGESAIIDGKRRTFSLVRMAKDPQRLVNLYVSNIATLIAAMPKNPYVGAAGAFLGFEDDWRKMNEEVLAFVQYNAKGVDGQLAPPPQREVSEPPIQALTLGLNQAIDAMKAAMGIYDASLGAGPGDTAGIAIQKRQKESDVANFHFSDNEARTRKQLGRILLELIPILDRGAREVPTRTEAGKSKMVKVNTVYRDDKTGRMAIHNLNQGNYEPAIATGPSYTSARQQANDAYAQIAANDKNFMTIAGDLYFRTSDMPGADLIADRYEKMLPPQLQPQQPGGPQQMQQLLNANKQLAIQHQALQAQLNSLSQVIEQKTVECQSRERIAAMQVWGQIRIQGQKSGDALAIADSDREAARLEGMFDRAHEHALASLGAGDDAASQRADQDHQRQMQSQGHDAAAQAAALAAANQPPAAQPGA